MITARILVASALLAGVSWVVWRLLDDLLGVSLAAQIVSVGAAGLAGVFVYVRAVLAHARARGPPGAQADHGSVRPRIERGRADPKARPRRPNLDRP